MIIHMHTCRVQLVLLLIVFSNHPGWAQNAMLIHKGTIQYQRRENAHAIYEKHIGETNRQYVDQYKVNNPQFKETDFLLSFNDSCSYYRPTNPNYNSTNALDNASAYNEVYSNVKDRIALSKKNLWGSIFYIEDSTRSIKWKITDEVKVIAGFTCRRANAVILDSVYVVAFYCDQIVPSHGPERFSGLPGVILAAYLPHEHISWVAQRLTLDGPDPKSLHRTTTSENKITYAGLLRLIDENNSIKNSTGTMGSFLKTLILL